MKMIVNYLYPELSDFKNIKKNTVIKIKEESKIYGKTFNDYEFLIIELKNCEIDKLYTLWSEYHGNKYFIEHNEELLKISYKDACKILGTGDC